MSADTLVGCVGELIVATRGSVGPGEVVVSFRGGREAFIAWSDQPIARGSRVLVIGHRGPRTVSVEEWNEFMVPAAD